MVDLWGSANYTMGLSGTVWPLHMGAGLYELAMPANTKFFFDHVTKPMVWGHSGDMGHTGTFFVLLRNVYCGGYFGR